MTRMPFRRRYSSRRYRRRVVSNQENKFFDLAWTQALNGTGVYVGDTKHFASINIVRAGVQSDRRIGRKFTIRSINVRIVLTASPIPFASKFPTTYYRCIIYQDRQCNGLGIGTEATAATHLLQPTPTDDGSVANDVSVRSFYNLANTQRFKILYDRIGSINRSVQTGANYYSGSKVLTYSRTCNIPIEMTVPASGGTATLANITSNNIGILLFADEDNAIESNISTRIRYVDS